MANAYFYSNIAVPTTLSGNINNSVGSCTVTDTTGWPSSYPYIISIDYNTANEELVRVTNNAAGTLTIVRGFGSTSAVSHSSGAAVRHVLNAQDFTDFRTHEAATSAAHGIAGSFVGTTDIQTLTNKTLTAPAITNPAVTGGGSLAGTFTGTPTFNGNVTFSAAPQFTGTPAFTNGASLGTGTFSGAATFSGNVIFSGTPNLNNGANWSGQRISYKGAFTGSEVAVASNPNSETFDRWRVNGDGSQEWGAGTTARDTFFARSAARVLTATGTLRSAPTNTADTGLAVNLPSGTSGDIANYQTNSVLQAAMDATGVYRTYGTNTPTTFTPTVANGGTVTWTVRTGIWWRLGKIIFVNIYLTVNAAGSGATPITVTGPVNIDRSIRQMIPVNVEGSATLNGSFSMMAFTGGATNVFDRIRAYDGGTMTGGDLTAGALITMQGWYREA